MRPIRLILFFLLCAVSMHAASTRLGDVSASGEFNLQSGGSFVALNGSTVDLSACTLTMPADFTRLGSSISLTSEVAGILPVANGGTGTATPGLIAGSNVTISGIWPNQTIASSGSGGSGETNTASNLGSGTDGLGIFGDKSGVDLRFKRLKAGANITLTSEANDILINAAGGSGSGGISFVSAPAFSNSAGTAGQIAYDADYFYLAVGTNTWKRAALSTFTAAAVETTLTYVSDGDANGVFNYIGTANGTTTFSNPDTSGALVSLWSAAGSGTPTNLVDRVANDMFTSNTANSWIGVDLKTYTVAPTAYTMRAYTGGGHFPRNWKLQGSNNATAATAAAFNAATWTDLDVRVADSTMGAASGFATFTVTGVSTPYRYLRILQNGPNSLSENLFAICEWELYGTLNY